MTAVGDPHQSIYGWRGASRGNLDAFPPGLPRIHRTVPAAPAGSRTCRRAGATTPPCSPRRTASRSRCAGRRPGSARGRPSAFPRCAAGPAPARGRCSSGGTPRSRTRSTAVADCGGEALAGGPGDRRDAGVDAPTAAVLCRVASQFPAGRGRPAARGSCPSRWSVSVACCTCRRSRSCVPHCEVLHDPTRGDSLVRLLAGPCRAVGPAGPRGAERLVAGAACAAGADPPVADLGRRRTSRRLVEALDELPPVRLAGSRRAAALRGRQAPAGTARPGSCATCAPAPAWRCPTSSPRSSGRSCSMSRSSATGGAAGATARAHLDAFVDVAGRLLRGSAEPPTLAGFLAWLPRPTSRSVDSSAPGEVRPARGPGDHRARGQGPGVGRGGGPRARRRRLSHRQRARAELGIERLGSAARSAPCPTRCAATRLACRTGLPRRRAARPTSPARSRRSRCWPVSTRSPRSADWRTWRRRAPARSWRSPAPSGATDPRRASRVASCRRSPASPRTWGRTPGASTSPAGPTRRRTGRGTRAPWTGPNPGPSIRSAGPGTRWRRRPPWSAPSSQGPPPACP